MSFQLDGFPIIRLTHSTFSHAKKACSLHDSLPQELQILHDTLSHLQSSVSNPNSPIHQARKSRRQELKRHIEGCEEQLRRLKAILKKYNSLSEEDRWRTPLWESVRFSEGGPVQDVAEMKRKISMYGTTIDMLLYLFTQDSRGRMEKVVCRVRGEMKGAREAVDLVLAKPCGESCGREGALLTNFSAEDRTWWRELRHGLVKNGYNRKLISGNMDLIQGYVKELGERGAFDRGRNHSRLLGNGGFKIPLELEDTPLHMISRGYGSDLVLEAPIPRRAISVLVRNAEYFEEQLLRAPGLWIETMEEDDDTESSDSDSSTPTLLTESTFPSRSFLKARPATRVEKRNKSNKSRKHREKHSEMHNSHHRSHPSPVSKSSTSSSSKSSSKSNFTRSFWGFILRPK